MENRCCDAAGTEDCHCEQERWVRVSERLPMEGVDVLWYDPKDEIAPVIVAHLENGKLDWGGDLLMPLKDWEYWSAIPELPVKPKARKRTAT
jgi:hypothetical protein